MSINQGTNSKKKIVPLLLATFAVAIPIVAVVCASEQVYAEENIQKIEIFDTPQFYSGIKIPEYDVSMSSAFSANSSSFLMYNTTFGAWSDSFLDYNCYGYALGRKDWCHIGQFANIELDVTKGYNCNGAYVVSLNNSIQELAEFTVKDLRSLGYPCVSSVKNWFYEPYENQTLICVRKSKTDFHFMKYVDGNWLHKPGNTWILKYNTIPNVNEDWIAEWAAINNGEIMYQSNVGYPYTGDIYFIKYANSHCYNSYQYINENEHFIYCRNCSSTLRNESHTFTFYKGSKPGKICTGCGYILYNDGLGQIIMKEGDEVFETN